MHTSEKSLKTISSTNLDALGQRPLLEPFLVVGVEVVNI